MDAMERQNNESAPGYFHMYANGDDAKEFVISEDDYRFQFNLVGVCAYNSGAEVLAFSIEDSHPHIFLFGTIDICLNSSICMKAPRGITSYQPEEGWTVWHLIVNLTD